MTEEVIWTLDSALDFVRRLEATLSTSSGFHCALCGGVLREGSSRKDLDVVVFPHCSTQYDFGTLVEVLVAFGMERVKRAHAVKAIWNREGPNEDQKHVEVWRHEGRRVDLMFLR